MKAGFGCGWIAIVASAGLSADFARVHIQTVPVDRLAQNIERQMKDKPDDIGQRLNLARLYAMAYALKTSELKALSTGGTNLVPWFGHLAPTIPETVTKARSQEHQERARADLARAIGLYQDVIARAPDNFIGHLGLGWSLEQAGQVGEAIAEYRTVVEIGFPVERKRVFLRGQEPATTEAVQRLKALLDPVKDAQELAALQEKASELGRLARAITPIAIPLGDTVNSPPLAPQARVLFDADGSGFLRPWTWIDKDAGWLVYDADGSGEITSALQWFGSVTFWLFWSNGYQALAALDDNGDGELRGEELRHLAIWRDRNQNGVSERAEVRPLAAHGVVALSCAHVDGDSELVAAFSPHGVTMGDGTTRTSYDVILRTSGPPRSLTRPVH